MAELIKVEPLWFTGWTMSIAQLWGSGPKLSVQCGHCELVFQDRIKMHSYPPLKCPYCNAINIIPVIV